MGRPALLGAVFAAVLLVAAPAVGDPGDDKARVDARIGDLQRRLDEAQAREGVLTSDLSAVSAKMRTVQADVDAGQALLGALETELAAQRSRLGALDQRLQEQGRRLDVLQGEYGKALRRLEQRVREIYEADTPDLLSFALGTDSFGDLLDNMELLNRIGRQDERIVADVKHAQKQLAHARAETRRTRAGVAEATRAIAERTEQQRATRDRLVANRDALLSAQRLKESALGAVREDRQEFIAEVDALQAQSAALAATIAAAQAAAAQGSPVGSDVPAVVSSTPSAAGLVWPVAGPVTSGFGLRWGRMHEGIDIAVPTGTPVRAAAAGTVISAGWLGGYGNLVVVDHGNGLATAYAHNSGFAASVGQQVAQGQVVAYSGSTGHSSGPHVHFEVRVNGSATDPFGYL